MAANDQQAKSEQAQDSLVPTRRRAPRKGRSPRGQADQEEQPAFSKQVVVIKGLPIGASEDNDVKPLAAEFGEIESIRSVKLRRRRDGEERRPVFSVRFTTTEAADGAVKGLTGKSVSDNELTCEFKVLRRRRRTDKGQGKPAQPRRRIQRVVDPVKAFLRVADSTEEQVRDFLKDCGTIKSMEVAASGVSYTITFADAEGAKAALELHGQKIGENEVQVRPFRTLVRVEPDETEAPAAKKGTKGQDKAKAPRKKRTPNPPRRLFVAGFPADLDPELMLDTFEGSIKATVRNQTAFVTFETHEFAQKCIDGFSGKVAFEADQPLRVEFARVPRRARRGGPGRGKKPSE